MSDLERIDAELAAMRERIAYDSVRMVELEAEVAKLAAIVSTIAENGDIIATGLERHQAHHEAVEELLDKPITRAIVDRMIRDIAARDQTKRDAEREARAKIITNVVNTEVDWS